ncbi:DUF1427 family protein [Paraburkholderia bannensis]|nr:DUF1427 family protein [Paraburkholderia bannensis]RQM44003.1 DUF1427 family protein [Paraburkholderia bannensis]
MIACMVSLAIGLLVGIFYGVIGIRSPAPPVIALLGLLGIALGEQIPPISRHLISGDEVVSRQKIIEKVLTDEEIPREQGAPNSKNQSRVPLDKY